MITITIAKPHSRHISSFHSTEKAKKTITPIVMEMKRAKREKRSPKEWIDGVSYDTESERAFLIENGALKTANDEDVI